MPLKAEEANALQISAVPFCTFVRSTRTQTSPPPAIPVTVTREEQTWSVEMNASNSSLPEVVENEEVLTVVFAVPWFPEAFASIAIAPEAGWGASKHATTKANHAQTETVDRCIYVFLFVHFPCWVL
jgi:hypothetical protein